VTQYIRHNTLHPPGSEIIKRKITILNLKDQKKPVINIFYRLFRYTAHHWATNYLSHPSDVSILTSHIGHATRSNGNDVVRLMDVGMRHAHTYLLTYLLDGGRNGRPALGGQIELASGEHVTKDGLSSRLLIMSPPSPADFLWHVAKTELCIARHVILEGSLRETSPQSNLRRAHRKGPIGWNGRDAPNSPPKLHLSL